MSAVEVVAAARRRGAVRAGAVSVVLGIAVVVVFAISLAVGVSACAATASIGAKASAANITFFMRMFPARLFCWAGA